LVRDRTAADEDEEDDMRIAHADPTYSGIFEPGDAVPPFSLEFQDGITEVSLGRFESPQFQAYFEAYGWTVAAPPPEPEAEPEEAEPEAAVPAPKPKPKPKPAPKPKAKAKP
jgi:outer membrane biosynthesis protein TonB